jgi:hypothetical protein
LVGVAVALAAAACGGSPEQSGQASLTHEEFAKRANAICQKYAEHQGRLSPASNLKQLATQISILLPFARTYVQQFAALKPPRELKADAEAFAQRGTVLIGRLLATRKAALAGNLRKVLGLSRLARAEAETTRQIGERMGLLFCAA